MKNKTFAERYLEIANEKRNLDIAKEKKNSESEVFKPWWQKIFKKISSNNTMTLDPAFKKLIKDELEDLVLKGRISSDDASSFWNLSDNELVLAYDEFLSTLG